VSFPAYQSYRESGVEWLGRVPSHWETKPLKAVTSCNDEVLTEATPPDYEIEYVEISDVQAGRGIKASTSYSFSDAPSRARRKLRDGDVLVSTVRTYLRAIAQVREPAENLIASTGFAVLRPQRAHSDFIGYAVQAEETINEIIARSVGVSYPAINASDLVRIAIAVPPVTEQRSIAAFLDRETAKIDALVEAQERLIALLKEKRQAVISHAVTKGLDPSAQMKDSGVEWLGQVPAHWEVVTVRRLATRVQTGTTPSSEPASADTEVGMDWFTPGDFGSGVALNQAAKRISIAVVDGGEARVFPAGSVLVIGIGATLGRVGVALTACSANQQINAISPDDTVDPFFLAYALSVQEEIMRKLSNASTIGIMNQDRTKDLSLCRPPLQEQAAIVAGIGGELQNIDALASQAEAAITLLQERRAALISAAVTGKIDVRGLVQTAEAA